MSSVASINLLPQINGFSEGYLSKLTLPHQLLVSNYVLGNPGLFGDAPSCPALPSDVGTDYNSLSASEKSNAKMKDFVFLKEKLEKVKQYNLLLCDTNLTSEYPQVNKTWENKFYKNAVISTLLLEKLASRFEFSKFASHGLILGFPVRNALLLKATNATVVENLGGRCTLWAVKNEIANTKTKDFSTSFFSQFKKV